MKKLAALILLSFSAQADYLHLGGWSKHLVDGNFNETHHLIAIEHDNYIIGGFVNSFDDYTLLAGKKFSWQNENESLEWGFLVGITYGYSSQDVSLSVNGFMPVLVPYLSCTEYKVQPALLLLGNAVAITFRIEL